MIVAVKLTLVFNSVSSIYTLRSSGKLILFIAGSCVVWKIFWNFVDEKIERSFRDFKVIVFARLTHWLLYRTHQRGYAATIAAQPREAAQACAAMEEHTLERPRAFVRLNP